MKINIFNQTQEDIKPYQKILTKVFKHIKDKQNVNIILIDDQTIKSLNNQFRNIAQATDVLSFINDEDINSNGDIFISLPTMKRQALEYGHSEEREISFLAVHGYLHLKGYDHETPDEEKKMHLLTEEILKKAKLERVK